MNTVFVFFCLFQVQGLEDSLEGPLHWRHVTESQKEQGRLDRALLLKAHGGPEVWRAIQSIKIETIYQSLRRQRRRYQRVTCYLMDRPAYVHGSFVIWPLFRGFDGHVPWFKEFGEEIPFPPKRYTVAESTFYWAQEIPILLRETTPMVRLGREIQEDEALIQLRFFHPDTGQPIADVWVSEEVWQIREISWWRASGEKGKDPLHFDDYQQVGGIRLPHKWFRAGSATMEETILRIELNPDLGDHFFEPWTELLVEAPEPLAR